MNEKNENDEQKKIEENNKLTESQNANAEVKNRSQPENLPDAGIPNDDAGDDNPEQEVEVKIEPLPVADTKKKKEGPGLNYAAILEAYQKFFKEEDWYKPHSNTNDAKNGLLKFKSHEDTAKFAQDLAKTTNFMMVDPNSNKILCYVKDGKLLNGDNTPYSPGQKSFKAGLTVQELSEKLNEKEAKANANAARPRANAMGVGSSSGLDVNIPKNANNPGSNTKPQDDENSNSIKP